MNQPPAVANPSRPNQTLRKSQGDSWSTPVVSANGPANNHAPVELYDLENDPWELTNLADYPAYGRVLDQLRQQLLAWMEDTDDPLLRGLPASPAYHAGRNFLHQSHGGQSLVAEEQ